MEPIKLVIYVVATILAFFLELVISVSGYLLRVIRPPMQADEKDANPVIFGSLFNFTYVTSDWIGAGGNGSIYKAAVLDDAGSPLQAFVAVKEFFFNPREYFAQPEHFDELCRKYSLLPTIKHDNLISYRQVRIAKADLGGVSIKIAMDYYPDGDLAMYLERLHGRKELLDQAQAIHFALDIARGLQHLHAQHIINGDLKPQNVILHILPDGEIRLVICDLDGSIRMETNKTCSRDITQRYGTDGYMAPEVLKKFAAKGMEQNDPAVASILIGRSSDIWSLGCILVDFGNAMTGAEPVLHYRNHFVPAGAGQLGYMAWKGFLESGYIPYICDTVLADVARCCLQLDSDKRISAGDLAGKLQTLEEALQAPPGGGLRSYGRDFCMYDRVARDGVSGGHGRDIMAVINPKRYVQIV
ncbi:mitogen-activated protein kinase kinase kinase 4-like [Paramacrobiotus metropolitanus]|uniref:mitogen-activated protein kinase kinase kinase 4-like n=1 Tax=Paramacrobiotus metropolitanus TaxID=2943436 RepID=UPI00244569DD|nr:mitogen-activated protein kinase kinase kinase 4-like [Paramacrobiotus metropolitanus]